MLFQSELHVGAEAERLPAATQRSVIAALPRGVAPSTRLLPEASTATKYVAEIGPVRPAELNYAGADTPSHSSNKHFSWSI
jgi:hypothetical protein